MTEAIVVALITGVCSVAAASVTVAVTNRQSSQNWTIKLDKSLAVYNEKLSELSDRMDKFDETVKMAYKHDKDIAVLKIRLGMKDE